MKYNILKILIILFVATFGTNLANATFSLLENTNDSDSNITENSIKINVIFSSVTTPFNVIGQISKKPTEANPFAVLSTTAEKIVGVGASTTISFEFFNLDKGTDYTIHLKNSSPNPAVTFDSFESNHKTKGVPVAITKVYINGQLIVGDTTADISYTVITGGNTKNIALKYSTTDANLVETVYPTTGGFGELSVMGTATNPADAVFNLTGLAPDTHYDFWVIDTDAIKEDPISIKNSFHTLKAGAQPYAVYAGIAEGACPKGEYCYLAPLGDKTSINTENNSIGNYLGYIFKFGIGLAGVLAVLMLIIAGIQYMGSDSFFSKEEAKGSITNALIGLLIALASYLILNTLNPDLVNLKLNISKETIEIETPDYISEVDYTKLTGLPLLKESDYDAQAKIAATNAGIEFCHIKAVMTVESRTKPNAIGHDENVNGTSWNKKFIDSKHTFLSQPITNKNLNDDEKYCDTKTGMCLDWRFSHGIGLMQITFFPNSDGVSWEPRTDLGITTNPIDQLKPEQSLSAGAFFLASKIKKYPNNLEKAFCSYNAGTCKGDESDYAKLYGKKTLALYQQCKESGK